MDSARQMMMFDEKEYVKVKDALFNIKNMASIRMVINKKEILTVEWTVRDHFQCHDDIKEEEYLLHVTPYSGICACIDFPSYDSLYSEYVRLKKILGGDNE